MITGFGGDVFVCKAFLTIPKTITKRKKDVVDINANGTNDIEAILSNKPIEELNWSGCRSDSKSMLTGICWEKTLIGMIKTRLRNKIKYFTFLWCLKA